MCVCRSGKLPSASVRWQQVSKLQRKVSTSEEEPSVGDTLVTEIKDIITTYLMVSSVGVSRGLYLGYLQCQTSVALLRAQRLQGQVEFAVARPCPGQPSREQRGVGVAAGERRCPPAGPGSGV